VKPRIPLWVFVIVGLIAFYVPGLIEIQELRAKRDELRTEVESLKEKNLSLQKEKALLEQDIHYVERVARKEMGVVRKGETPFKILTETSPQNR